MFCAQFGFSRAHWRTLASALAKHAADHEVVKTEESRFGMRYIVEDRLEAPDGRRPANSSGLVRGDGQRYAQIRDRLSA